MADTITLTTPIARPSVTGFTPGSLYLGYAEGRIFVTLIGSDGQSEVFEYPAPGTPRDTPAKVRTLIQTLSTTNLATRSLWQLVMDKLTVDFPTRFPGGATVG